MVNITANRSMRGGVATVKWDDEGVEPKEVTLVRDGILTDFQTTRESASWIREYYNRIGKTTQSTGNAGRDKASLPTTQQAPNICMTPGNGNVTFEDMIADTKRGYAVIGGTSSTDQQALNGAGDGRIVYEIRNGKLGDVIRDSNYLYRAPEFWKNVVAIGSAGEVRNFGLSRGLASRPKELHTVSTVPAKVTQIAMMNTMRKA